WRKNICAGEPGSALDPWGLLLAELHARVVVLAVHGLHHSLSTMHLVGRGIEGQARRTVQFPALVERIGDAMTKGRVVRSGEETIDFHDALPSLSSMSRTLASSRSAWSRCSRSTMRPSRLMTLRPATAGSAKAATI